MPKLLFLVYADVKYEFFVVPYIFFALKNNSDAVVEVVLSERDNFINRNKESLTILNSIFGDRYTISQSPKFEKIIPNTIRFITQPKLRAEYLYIGDIDILVFENVAETHVKLMEDYNLPFSNIIRESNNQEEPKRLTGLHFCRYDDYYPIPCLDDLELDKMNDEVVLYEIMMRRGMMVDPSFRIRPECGIHMSLNRDPLGRYQISNFKKITSKEAVGWGGANYYPKFLEQIHDKDFMSVFPYLDLKFRFFIQIIESIAKDKFYTLQYFSLKYLNDRKFFLKGSEEELKNLLAERDSYIKAKDFDRAADVGLKAIMLWPNNTQLWLKHAWLMLAMGNHNIAAECFKLISSLDGGIEILARSDIFTKNAALIESLGQTEKALVDKVLKEKNEQ